MANLAWTYSTLQYDHPQLYDSLAAAVVRLLGPEPQTDTIEAAAGGASSGSGAGESEPWGSSSSSSGDRRAGFGAQAVSMAAFSFAAANRCDSPAQRAAMLALAGRADEILGEFTPQGLSNLAWGLTVAACYPPKVRLRCCAASWHAVADQQLLIYSRWAAAAASAQSPCPAPPPLPSPPAAAAALAHAGRGARRAVQAC